MRKRFFKQGSYKCSGLVVCCCLLGLFIALFLSKFGDFWTLAFYFLSCCLAPGSGFREGYMDITIFCLAPFIFPNLYGWLSWFLMRFFFITSHIIHQKRGRGFKTETQKITRAINQLRFLNRFRCIV